MAVVQDNDIEVNSWREVGNIHVILTSYSSITLHVAVFGDRHAFRVSVIIYVHSKQGEKHCT